MSIFNISFLGKPESADEFSNSLTSNYNFTSTTKDSTPKETIAYICGLRTRIECEPFSEHSTHSDRVTNIGYRFFWGASPLPAANQKLIVNDLNFQHICCSRASDWYTRSNNGNITFFQESLLLTCINCTLEEYEYFPFFSKKDRTNTPGKV